MEIEAGVDSNGGVSSGMHWKRGNNLNHIHSSKLTCRWLENPTFFSRYLAGKNGDFPSSDVLVFWGYVFHGSFRSLFPAVDAVDFLQVLIDQTKNAIKVSGLHPRVTNSSPCYV